MRAIDRAIGLREQIKYRRKQLGWDSGPIVAHGDGRIAAFAINAKPDFSTFFRVFGGVVEQIRNRLRHASDVCIDLEYPRCER